jgi:beta-xylosidase
MRVRSAFWVAFVLLVFVFGAVAEGIDTAPKPLYRDPVYDGAADPTIIWDHTGHRWIMFYTNRRASAQGLTGVTWVHGTQIGMAESHDDGRTWKYIGTAHITYGKSDYTYWAPEVIEHDGTYHMYLSVVPGIFNDWNAPREIVHLTSSNLLDWKYESMLDLQSDRVIDPCVIQLPDGSWRMWFKNERAKDGSIYAADSSDLVHWKTRGVALPGAKGEGPKVFRWKDRYWLVFDAWNGLGVYSSSDCLNWVRQDSNLVQQPGTLPTDRTKGNHPDVVISSDGRAYLFYFTHQVGADAEGKPADWKRHTVIQVAELAVENGILTCDRDKPVHINLKP